MAKLWRHLVQIDERIKHLNTIRNNVELLHQAEVAGKTLTNSRDGSIVLGKLNVIFDELPEYIVTPEMEVYWKIRTQKGDFLTQEFNSKAGAERYVSTYASQNFKSVKFTETLEE